MSGEPRTSKLTILGRFAVYGWSFGVMMFYIFTFLGIAATIGPFIVGGLLGIGLLVLFVWGCMRLIGYVLFGSTPQYQQFINEGGDPYLDFVPAPFNTDSWTQRLGGLREPQYTCFVPPQHWQNQCPCCGARSEDTVDTCWNCGYGHSIIQCPHCGGLLKETNPGDFERDLIICGHCSCTFQMA